MGVSTIVCRADELEPGGVRIVELDGKSIGVFNVGGEFRAYLNRCPHQFAPVCLGKITGTNEPSAPGEYQYGMEGRVLRCPWHSWEFDLSTGEALFIEEKRRLIPYRVEVEDGNLVLFAERLRTGDEQRVSPAAVSVS